MAEVQVVRLLGAVRLSRETDESTSPARQNEQLDLSARIRGDRLVHVAQDLDVSGAVSPFDRDELGPWLTDPDKIAQWDGLIVAKIDRLTRSLYDFADLVRWCDQHGKTLISVTESIDLSTAHGRMIANVLVTFADFERARGGERRREAAEAIRQTGRWNGGRPPYGYTQACVCHGKPECKEATGWNLIQGPEALIVRRIVSQIIDGMPMSQVCQTLNSEDVPTPRGAQSWEVNVVKKMVHSRYLRGELQYHRHTVRDPEGSPVMVTDEPIISEHEWTLLQEALADKARPHRTRHDQFHMLLRIAYCGECDSPMYHQHNGPYDYYRCHGKHGAPAIRSGKLEEITEDFLLTTYGEDQIERRVSNGKDYVSEVRLTEHELSELEDQYMAHNLSAERFARMSTRLEARLAELHTLTQRSISAVWEPTGETVRERWEHSTAEERHAMLRRLGLRWLLRREYRISDHAWRWHIASDWLPVEESHERLSRMSA